MARPHVRWASTAGNVFQERADRSVPSLLFTDALGRPAAARGRERAPPSRSHARAWQRPEYSAPRRGGARRQATSRRPLHLALPKAVGRVGDSRSSAAVRMPATRLRDSAPPRGDFSHPSPRICAVRIPCGDRAAAAAAVVGDVALSAGGRAVGHMDAPETWRCRSRTGMAAVTWVRRPRRPCLPRPTTRRVRFAGR